jgi:hypothetical protein
MVRQARLDVPGVLHHVMARVFEGRPGLNGFLFVPAIQSFGNWQMVTHPDDGLFQLAKARKVRKNKGLKGFLCLC